MEDEYQKTDGVRERKRDKILADISSYSISAHRLHVDPSSNEPGPATDIESLEARLATTEDARTAQALTNFQPPAARNGPSNEVEPVARVEAYLPHGPSEILRFSRPLTAARISKSRQLTGSPLGPNQPADKSNLEAHMLTNTVLLFYDANGKIARSVSSKTANPPPNSSDKLVLLTSCKTLSSKPLYVNPCSHNSNGGPAY
jgi:hypothetical protein